MDPLDLYVPSSELDVLNADKIRPTFEPGYFCCVTSCDQRHYGKYMQYMRHWRKFHVPKSSLFVCPACNQHYENWRMEIREHLIKIHNYGSLQARRTAQSMERRQIINKNYRSPDKIMPPVKPKDITVSSIEVTEEVIIVEVGDDIPRDMDTELIERNGEFVLVLKKMNPDFRL